VLLPLVALAEPAQAELETLDSALASLFSRIGWLGRYLEKNAVCCCMNSSTDFIMSTPTASSRSRFVKVPRNFSTITSSHTPRSALVTAKALIAASLDWRKRLIS
jgi:hypothetical protein